MPKPRGTLYRAPSLSIFDFLPIKLPRNPFKRNKNKILFQGVRKTRGIDAVMELLRIFGILKIGRESGSSRKLLNQT